MFAAYFPKSVAYSDMFAAYFPKSVAYSRG